MSGSELVQKGVNTQAMSENTSEQRIGYGFGLLGGVLIALGGLVSLLLGFADLVTGHMIGALNADSQAIVLFVVGGLAAFFAWLGHREWSARPLVTGVMLVTLAFVGWLAVGVGVNVIALVGALLVFLGGILFVIEPARNAVHTAVSTP